MGERVPNYDYKCNECDHVYELFHGMSDDPEFECPKCKSKEATKQIGIPLILDGKPSWDKHEDIKRFINKSKPKRIKDERTGISKPFPKGGV